MSDESIKSVAKRVGRLEIKVDEGFAENKKQFEKIDERFDELMAMMSNFVNEVNRRFSEHDERFDRIEARLRDHDDKSLTVDTDDTIVAHESTESRSAGGQDC